MSIKYLNRTLFVNPRSNPIDAKKVGRYTHARIMFGGIFIPVIAGDMK